MKYNPLSLFLQLHGVMRLRSVGRAVGQLTVGWRVGKARERGFVRASVRKGFIAASQLAHNVWRLGEGCITDAQFSHKLSGSFCQTAVMCWAVYQH